jgi:hypothetical protein
MVVACTALLFAMTGAGYAAGMLGPNTVGTKQLKKNAVTSPKVKNNAITGADVNEGSLAKVPSAANADNAANATNAASAANAANLGGQPPSAYAASANEAYHEVGAAGQPPFQNGWGNFSPSWSSAGYYIDSLGVVHLKGTITGGTSSAAAFTLPAGYRPTKSLFFLAASNTGEALLEVLSDGSVVPINAGTTFGLDGTIFRAGAG